MFGKMIKLRMAEIATEEQPRRRICKKHCVFLCLKNKDRRSAQDQDKYGKPNQLGKRSQNVSLKPEILESLANFKTLWRRHGAPEIPDKLNKLPGNQYLIKFFKNFRRDTHEAEFDVKNIGEEDKRRQAGRS